MPDENQIPDLTTEAAQDSIVNVASKMMGPNPDTDNGDGDGREPQIQQSAPAPKQTATDPDVILVPNELLNAPADSGSQSQSQDDFNIEEINAIDVQQIPAPMRPNFAKMRDKLNGMTRDMQSVAEERDKLKEQLANTPKTPEDIQKQFADREAELLDTIGQLNIERHPMFIQKYENQRKPVIESIGNTLSSYNVEGLNVDQAVRFCATLAPHERVSYLQNALPEEIVQAGLATLLPMFGQLDIIESTRRAEIQNHATTSAAIEQQNNAAETSQLLQIRDEAKTEAITATAESEFLLKTVDGNEKWNEMVSGIKSGIETIFASTDPKVHAKALVESQLMPVYKLLYLQEQKQRSTLEEIIRSRNIALPKIDDSSAATRPTPTNPREITEASAAQKVAGAVWG